MTKAQNKITSAQHDGLFMVDRVVYQWDHHVSEDSIANNVFSSLVEFIDERIPLSTFE